MATCRDTRKPLICTSRRQPTRKRREVLDYDFNLGPWQLYALDSNCEYVGGCAEGSEQYKWLTSKVNETSPVCSIGFWHHPVYTSGVHKDVVDTSRARAILNLLDDTGVDIVLNGHDHHYERITPGESGLRQFISGAGGYSLRKVSEPFALGQEKVIDDQFGYLYQNFFRGHMNGRIRMCMGMFWIVGWIVADKILFIKVSRSKLYFMR